MEPREIEFKHEVTERQALKYHQNKTFRSTWFKTFYASLILVPLIALFTIEKYTVEGYIGFVFWGAVITFPLFAFTGKEKYKFFYLPENAKTFFVNEQGYGHRTEGEELLRNWKSITSIQETNKYLLFNVGKKSRVIFKQSLPDDAVTELKEILQQVPVKTKILLPEAVHD